MVVSVEYVAVIKARGEGLYSRFLRLELLVTSVYKRILLWLTYNEPCYVVGMMGMIGLDF